MEQYQKDDTEFCNLHHQKQSEETIAYNYQLLAAKQEKEAKAQKGCYTAIIGGVVDVLGIVIGFFSGGKDVGGMITLLLIVGGLLTGIIGVVVGMSYSD